MEEGDALRSQIYRSLEQTRQGYSLGKWYKAKHKTRKADNRNGGETRDYL